MGPWQRGIAYKGFSPSVTSFEGIDVEKILSMQEMPVQSAIVYPPPPRPACSPSNPLPEGGSSSSSIVSAAKDAVEAGDESVEVRGWAWSGGGRGIARVDVSADGGKTWHTAELGEG